MFKRLKHPDLIDHSWPAGRIGEAVDWLARYGGLVQESSSSGGQPIVNNAQLEGFSWTQRVEIAASSLGVEVEPFTCTYKQLEEMVQGSAPAIIFLPVDNPEDEPRFLAIRKSGRNRCELLDQNLKVIRTTPTRIAEMLRGPLAAPYMGSAERLISIAGIPAARREKISRALISSWLNAEIIPLGWYLRPSPGASWRTLIRYSSMSRELWGWAAAFLAQQTLFLLSWWLMGQSILTSRMDSQRLTIWILLLLSGIPFQLLVSWMQTRFFQSVGVVFKQRVLYGALKMNPDDIRHLGTGQMLERVMEIDAVEMLVLGGGLTAIISFTQLVAAAWVISKGGGGMVSVAALVLWVIALLAAGWINYGQGKKWTVAYRTMTNNLVEKMVGHRTRLAQENPANRHDEEDQELTLYQDLSQRSSFSGVIMNAIPSSWLVVGLASLVPALISNEPTQAAQMAISLGGVMFAYQAFMMIQSGIQNDIQLLLTWEQVKPIYLAASTMEENPRVTLRSDRATGDAAENCSGNSPENRKALLSIHRLNYRYTPTRRPALQDCDLQVYAGDHIILEGPSGGGKTTFAAILSGLRKPESGFLFLKGYDRHSLGETAWRRRVIMAPQFHENHIFNETFAFNLLMGRRWPPQSEDMKDAEEICSELGLGDLLARMPSGWQQMVGESGWQLSHGERSRVFIARALLQEADMVIMDESFGALDPENLFKALDCVQRRVKTLLVIAHP